MEAPLKEQVSWFEDTSIAFANRSNSELKFARLLFLSFNSRLIVHFGSVILLALIRLGLPLKGLIKKTVFRQFCGGESIQESMLVAEDLGKYGVGSILDYSVEGEKSEKGFEAAAEEIKSTILAAKSSDNIPFSVFKMSGVANIDLLAKVQTEDPLNEAEKAAFARIEERVGSICSLAAQEGVRLFIDAEETWIQDPINSMVIENALKFNKEKCIIWNTYQMYRKDALEMIKAHHKQAQENGILWGAKLVRGAYMEKERARASELGYPDPINPNKKATDELYDSGALYCLKNIQDLYLCLATHNENSSQLLAEEMAELNIAENDERVYFAQLYGMSDHISYNLAKRGFNVAKYLPYGPVYAVMPYLTRRAEENRSVKGQSSRELQLVNQELRRRRN